MAKTKAKKNITVKKKISRSKTERSYRRVVLVFSVVTLMLVFIITYFSLSKTVISIKPEKETLVSSLNVSIKTNIDNDDPSKTLTGRLLSKDVTDSLIHSDLETTKTILGKAGGQVTIYNNWSQVQPLQATTRLLSDGGILFRTKERIDVPPGSEVVAEIEADQEGETGNIDASRFTLPGLSLELQDKIYAESEEAMTGGTKDVTIVTEEDIETAKEQLNDQLAEKAKLELAAELDTKAGERISDPALKIEVLAESVDKEIEAEAESITITETAKAIAILFNEEDLLKIMAAELTRDVPEDKELLAYDPTSLTYTISQYDVNNQTALLKAEIKGQTIVKASSHIFDPAKIINRNRQEIKNYFSNFDEIKSVEVKFSPFWVFRAPALKDHIKFEIIK